MIAPNTNIRLLKTPMELNDANTLSFDSETDKYNYFNSLPKLTLDGATYQRKEGVLRYPTNSSDTFEDLLQYNYCMYQNASYDTKWFYAYIDDIKYINDGMTELKLRTDTFMTWQNDIVYKQSFIERQHVNNDTIGLHTIPENLETGEYIEKPLTASEMIDWRGLIGTCRVVLGLSKEPNEYALPQDYTSVFGNVYSALKYIACYTPQDAINYIKDIQSQVSEDPIVLAYMVPDKLLNNTSYSTPTGKNYTIGYVNSYNGYKYMDTLYLNKPTSLNGYVPKNNKVYCYPNTYLMLSNNVGENNIYRYELFSTSNCGFEIDGVLSVGCSIKAWPRSYNYTETPAFSEIHFNQSTNASKIPTCSWKNDAFTNWLTANSVDLGVGVVGGVGSVLLGSALALTGAGTPAGVGMIGGGLASIFNSVKNTYKASLVPDSAKGGSNQGDIVFASGEILRPSQFTIRYEYAKMQDDFFTMYGYKVNSLEVINIHKRTYFDYIKTIGCNIIGNIPQKDLEEIRNLFDNGLTIWHNPSYFLDYSVNNTIIV